MDHSKHVRLDQSELNEATLRGATIYGPGDEEIGDVSHMHGAGAGAQVVVDAGGFLGLGSKKVGLDIASLDFMRDEHGNVHATTHMSKDEIKSRPEHTD